MTEQELINRHDAQKAQEEKAYKVERYRHLNRYVKPGQIVFAGSSLMEQFPVYEFLMDFDLPYTIYNRGVGGFTTTEMMAVLPDCIYALKPKYLFLNIGTNDLNVPDYDQAALMARYDAILNGVEEHVPGVSIFLLAYYPVNPEVANVPWAREVFRHRTNKRICEANEGVKQLAAKHGARFLDLNAGITDENGNLKAEYTMEGMHMYADGYKPVLDALLPVLKAL